MLEMMPPTILQHRNATHHGTTFCLFLFTITPLYIGVPKVGVGIILW